MSNLSYYTSDNLHQLYSSSTPTPHAYPPQAVCIFLSALLCLVAIISLAGNSLICYLVYRRPAMRSAINLLLANLALSDLLLTIFNMSVALVVLNLQNWPLNRGLCQLNVVLFGLFNAEKVSVLVVISVDRLYIIKHRKDVLNQCKAKIITAVSWGIALLLVLPPVFGWGSIKWTDGQVQCNIDFQDVYSPSYIITSRSIIYFLPSFIMIVLFMHILEAVRKNRFRVQNHPPVNPTAMHKKGKMFIDYSYKTRTFTTLLILSLVYLACMLPLSIIDIWLSQRDNNVQSSAVQSGTKRLYIGLLWLSYSNSAFNPLIYYYRISKFRETCANFLPKNSMSLPKFMPTRTRRRIRPHVMYQVGKAGTKVTFIGDVM